MRDQAFVASYEEPLQAEERDEAWAAEIEAQRIIAYSELPADPDIGEFDVVDVECRTTLCRVDLNYRANVSNATFLEAPGGLYATLTGYMIRFEDCGFLIPGSSTIEAESCGVFRMSVYLACREEAEGD